MFRLNPWSVKGVSYHPAFMGNCPTIIHTFLALFTQWKSSLLQGNEDVGSVQDFNLLPLSLV